MRHYMHLKDDPFNKIWDGIKTIELRLYDEKRRSIRKEDEIVFTNLTCDEEQILVKVVDMYMFESFKQLYETLPLEKCGYAKGAIITAKPEDMNAYYPFEEQCKYGVVGIEFVVLARSGRLQ